MYVTGSKVIPMVKSMTGKYAEEERILQRAGEEGIKLNLCTEILAKLNARFGMIEGVRELALSALLDPRFKNYSFKDPHKKDQALMWLREELREHPGGKKTLGTK